MSGLISVLFDYSKIISKLVVIGAFILGKKDKIGFLVNILINIFLYSFILTFAYFALNFDVDKWHNFEFTTASVIDFGCDWLLVNSILFMMIYFVRVLIDCCYTSPVFSYVKASVENNIVDYYLLKASVTGDILYVVTHFGVVYLLFPKYSSSYDCKITEKKFFVAYVFKKGYLLKDNQIDFFEDNSIELLKKINNYKSQIRAKNENDLVFVSNNYVRQSKGWFSRFLFGNPYPQVPFYQILDEYEERIDFKDIKSISIYRCPQKDEQKE